MNERELSAYLDRIGYRGDRAPTVATLTALHRAHLFAVPFENLDIHRGRPIVLEPAAFFAKIVGERRGGFCYEQNGLFADALGALGFPVRLLSARVAGEGGALSPPFDHLALLVEVEGRRLADVGFGRSFHEPLSLDEPVVSVAEGTSYRAIASDGGFRVESRDRDGDWKPEYVFDLVPHPLADFAPRCRFHQTSPESHFMKNLVCSRPTPRGRVTVSGRALVVVEDGVRTETPLADSAAVASALAEHFDIRPSPSA